MSLVWSPCLARTAWDLVGCDGVRLGALYPLKVSLPRLIDAITSSLALPSP